MSKRLTTEVDVKALLDPKGAAVKEAKRGVRDRAQDAVDAHWNEVKEALDSGVAVAVIYRVLRNAGLVTVSAQAFAREVKARLEAAKNVGTTAKPAPRRHVRSAVKRSPRKAARQDGVSAIAVGELLDPTGEALQSLVAGRRGAGRVEVTVMWPQIERALDAGVSVSVIWKALHANGLVSVRLRGFSKQVNAVREKKGSGVAAEPASATRLLEGAMTSKRATGSRGSWRRDGAKRRATN